MRINHELRRLSTKATQSLRLVTLHIYLVAGYSHHEEISVHDQISVFRQSPEKIVGSGYPVLLLLELEDLRGERARRTHEQAEDRRYMEERGKWAGGEGAEGRHIKYLRALKALKTLVQLQENGSNVTGLFMGHDLNPRIGSGHFRNLTGRVGSSRVGSGHVGSAVFQNSRGSGPVIVFRPEPTRPDPT